MSRRMPGSDFSISGLGFVLLGIMLIAAPLFIPLSVTGWLGGDAYITFQIFEQVAPEGEKQSDYRLKGALVTVQKTTDDQMTPLDVFGKPSPTSTDIYGLMTFYCTLGTQYWKVEWNGIMIDGYVYLPEEGAGAWIVVYMNEGYADYSPDSAEVSEEGAPTPQPAPEEVTDTITVIVETYPFDVDNVAVFDQNTGEVYAHERTPIQFNHEGQFVIRIAFPDVDGYYAPISYEASITQNVRITGEYTESPPEPTPPPLPGEDPEPLGEEATSESVEFTDVEITSEEKSAYEATTVDDPDPSGVSGSNWDQRVEIIRKAKSPVFLGLQVIGIITLFIGAVQMAAPVIKFK